MKNSQRFIKIYNHLDDYMRDLLDESVKVSHTYLIDTLAKKNSLFRHYKNDLKEFAELRNAIVHNTHFSGKRFGEAIAEPINEAIKLYEELLHHVMQPKTAKDLYRRIDAETVLTANLNSPLIQIIKLMHNRKNTCVPILEAGKLVGVFSENVLLSLIARNDVLDFNNLKVREIVDYIDINSHHGEYFVFCKINDDIFKIKAFFQNQNSKKRLEMIFVTGNGNPKEHILGVISPWDLVGEISE